LKIRGLLEQTLVIWGGDFGRTPFTNGGDAAVRKLSGRPQSVRVQRMLPVAHPGANHRQHDEIGCMRGGKVRVHDLHSII